MMTVVHPAFSEKNTTETQLSNRLQCMQQFVVMSGTSDFNSICILHNHRLGQESSQDNHDGDDDDGVGDSGRV